MPSEFSRFALLIKAYNERQETWAKCKSHFTVLLLFFSFPSAASLGWFSEMTQQRPEVPIFMDGGQEESFKTADSACPVQHPLMLKGGSAWIREKQSVHVFVLGSHNAHIRNHAWTLNLLCHRAHTSRAHLIQRCFCFAWGCSRLGAGTLDTTVRIVLIVWHSRAPGAFALLKKNEWELSLNPQNHC